MLCVEQRQWNCGGQGQPIPTITSYQLSSLGSPHPLTGNYVLPPVLNVYKLRRPITYCLLTISKCVIVHIQTSLSKDVAIVGIQSK